MANIYIYFSQVFFFILAAVAGSYASYIPRATYCLPSVAYGPPADQYGPPKLLVPAVEYGVPQAPVVSSYEYNLPSYILQPIIVPFPEYGPPKTIFLTVQYSVPEPEKIIPVAPFEHKIWSTSTEKIVVLSPEYGVPEKVFPVVPAQEYGPPKVVVPSEEYVLPSVNLWNKYRLPKIFVHDQVCGIPQ
ncbi:hypothetical protein HHI36_004199 [Cryptolaemus montrouzieri]|uniref:Uncharacterized protein n=1 Tax=Cryptolaemus montrouzieri TaxID=559131 RepID=A0ABD2NR61_9CUCU